MQISPFHVQVFVLILHEKPGRKAVDYDPDAGRPGNGSALDGCRMQHPPHALGNDDPHGDEQDHGVEQRNEHRALLIAVGIPGRSMGLCKAESQHGQQQARHVGKVVPGIGQQPHRPVIEPDGEFDDNECHVERNAEDKGFVERRDRMVVMMVFVCHNRYISAIVSRMSERSTSLLTMA